MPKIQLIRAKMSDAPIIHAMQYEAFLPLYERYHDDETNPVKEPLEKVLQKLASENTDYFLIISGEKTVGAIRVVDDGMMQQQHVFRISPLFVLPVFQNQGIGYGAIQKVFSLYPDAGLWRLSTIRQEAGNCHLYEKCGFQRVGEEMQINEKMTLISYEKRK